MRMTKSRIPHHANLGSEESHVTESFERKIHGVPEIGQQREYSYNTYTERRTYGRDENGEVVVRIEKDPKEPVRPVSPVRPVTPVEPLDSVLSSKSTLRQQRASDNNGRRHKGENGYRSATPVQPFDTLPLSIPRIEIDKASSDAFSPRSYRTTTTTFYEHSPRSDDSLGYNSQSTRSGGASPRSVSAFSMVNSAVPFRKIIKESRWVSVHDGRPVSPYVQSVAYVPKYSEQEYVATSAYNDRNYRNDNGYSIQPKQVTYKDESYFSRPANSGAHIQTSLYDSCSVFIENPLYRD